MIAWKGLWVVMIWVCSTAQAAQTSYAQATVTETTVFLGQVFNLDVIVKAAEKPEAPAVADMDGFNVTLLEAGSPTSESNTWLYRFALRATREGSLTIPALGFGTVSTTPLSIQALKPQATDRMKLEQSLNKPSVYVGEPVQLTTTWDSTTPFGAIKAVDFDFPVLNDRRFQVMELYEPNKESNAQTTGLPVHGTRVLATRRSYAEGETQHQSLSFSELLIPLKSGRLVIAPATLLCAAEQETTPNRRPGRGSAFQYPAYFDNTFFDRNVTGDGWTRIYTESTPLELTVKPLPTAGRPNLFNGLVGDFTIKVEAEPVAVRVGEPITVTVTVTAADTMENISLPPLRDQPLLAHCFEIPAERSLPRRAGKSKIYTQTIRPLSTGVNEVPPIQLAYFSPMSHAYVTVQSEPIPLEVAPAEEIGVSDGGLIQSRLHAVKEGIRHNYEDPDMLENQRPPLLGWAPGVVVLSVLLLPPLLVGGFSLVSLYGEKKHHIHRTAKAARAYAVFRKNAANIVRSQANKSDIYRGLDQVLRAYLGDRLHLNPGALSFRDAETRLVEHGAEAQTLEDLKNLFTLCETYRFTKHYEEPGDAKQIVRKASILVKAVERTQK